MYGQQHAVDDAKHMLDHLKIDKAHVVGLSQGAFATAHFGRSYPEPRPHAHPGGRRLRRGPRGHEQFKKDARRPRHASPSEGMAKYAESLTTEPDPLALQAEGSARLRRVRRNICRSIPTRFGEHHAEYQGKRPSLYDSRRSGRSSTCRP